MALEREEKWNNTALKLSPKDIQRHLDDIVLRAAKKGYDTENFVEKAIRVLIRQGWIRWYHRSRHGDELDLNGIDFLLMFSPPEIVPLQVKSSEIGKRQHIAKYGDKIPCVVLYPHDTIEIMSGKILMTVFPDFYEKGGVDEEEDDLKKRPLKVKLKEILG